MGYRLGVTPLAAASWLRQPLRPERRAVKQGLLTSPQFRPQVVQALPESQAAQYQAALAIGQHLEYPLPKLTQLLAQDTQSPLAAAALLVPDDLCLLEQREPDAAYRLVAGVVCAPSYWRLRDKLGQPLTTIHAPVPGLNAAIGARIDRFMQGIPTGGLFERRNFFLHAQQDRFQPAADTARYQSQNVDLWMMRTERQQLKRLSERHILFSIDVTLQPWRALVAQPMLMQELLARFQQFDDSQIENFGGTDKWRVACRVLEQWLACA